MLVGSSNPNTRISFSSKHLSMFFPNAHKGSPDRVGSALLTNGESRAYFYPDTTRTRVNHPQKFSSSLSRFFPLCCFSLMNEKLKGENDD